MMIVIQHANDTNKRGSRKFFIFFSQNTLLLKSICAICGGLTCEKERKPMKYSYLKFI